MPHRYFKNDFLVDRVARMESTKGNAEIAECVSDFILSNVQTRTLKPHRSDGKPRNEYMLYVWKNALEQIGVGVYAPVVANHSAQLTAEQIMNEVAPEDYDAVQAVRHEIAELLVTEGFDYELTNEGVTPEDNGFGRRPYATLTVFYDADEGQGDMSKITRRTMKLMGATQSETLDYELMADESAAMIADLWDEISDVISLIYAQSQYHPSGSKIQDALEQLADTIG